ncbi:serine hydrolase domain-containing protein [Henriciella aquimarina]|uniref:serine hydrolase domain-containing protein n=1 Tax=Henriciella aquimarina TaxID=545261 RepID=UPI001179A2FD|nr:serine hydrolase domain-containing protein [Henriciella aquimarina]
MRRLILIALVTLACIIGWSGITLAAASEGWWRKPLTSSESPEAFLKAAETVIEDENTGNVAMILIEQGDIAGSHYASKGQRIDGDSLFQVASLSKWLSALGVMRLVENGRISLDAPVSTYLTRWSLPPSPYDNEGVTVRRLLSHTAGLGDGLGYNGFATKEAMQTLEASLTRAADASPGAEGSVRLVQAPGAKWTYSGGGYTLLQLLVEEVSGQSFSTFMDENIFDPLGMQRTTYDLDEAREMGLAENYRPDGETEPLRYYTALAAASAFTSANDLAALMKAHLPSAAGQENGVLTQETLNQMRRPHASQLGADIWGLGVMLYAPNNSGGFIVGHDGNNEPAINTAVRLDPETGDAIIILETGNNLLATRLAGEWVFWKTGNVDNLMFVSELETTIRTVIIGAILLLIAGILYAVRAWRLFGLVRTRIQ